jgi:hypothetical protein
LFYTIVILAYCRGMFDGARSLELDAEERRARLRLARGARIGPVTFHEALAHFGSARVALTRLTACPDADIDREEANLWWAPATPPWPAGASPPSWRRP